jgi:RNA polymerase sigma factor (sigma-70 family)
MPQNARDRIAAAYDAHYDVLRFIASQKFNVPAADVRPLLHDVFVSYIRHSAGVSDDRSWLVTTTRNACRNYWRDRKPTEPIPETLLDPHQLADDVGARVDVARLLRRLPQRCRMVLWLRYVDGVGPEEIAHRCAASDSPGYGRQLVHRCLRAARQALASLKDVV